MIAAYTPEVSGPLDGVRILDLSRLVAGNMLSLTMADFGADVIKLEFPQGGDTLRDWLADGVSVNWKVYARNKKSITIDIRTLEGKEILKKLALTAHALIESFRPGVMERLGLGPDVLHVVNPNLVYVRISGWGQTGPYRDRPGFGSLVEGISGFAAKNGFADRPPVLPNMALADMVAGLSGASALLIALREVEAKGGAGQVIDLSLLEPLFSTIGSDVGEYRVTGKVKQRSGNRASITAPRNIYRTRDGMYVALSASIEDMARRLFRAIGREDLIEDPKFRTNSDRLNHVEELDSIIQDFIGARDHEPLLKYFEEAEVTVGPVYDASQIMHDPHIVEREVIVEMPDDEMGSLPMHNISPRLSHTPGALRFRAPHLGEHTLEILRALNLDEDEVKRLREAKVV